MRTQAKRQTRPRRTDDTGVPRYYVEAAPNRMFSGIMTACIRFARYKEPVPCAVCGKTGKRKWTCVIRNHGRFEPDHAVSLGMPRKWFEAGTPVCEDHPMQPDERAFIRRARNAERLGDKKAKGRFVAQEVDR